MQFEEFDSFCAKLCRETEKVILRFYEDPDLEVIRKSDDTPVTAADRQSETMIREAIETLYPDHGIMGEEYGQTNAPATFSGLSILSMAPRHSPPVARSSAP